MEPAQHLSLAETNYYRHIERIYMKEEAYTQLYWLSYIETSRDNNRPVKLDAILAQRLRAFLDSRPH